MASFYGKVVVLVCGMAMLSNARRPLMKREEEWTQQNQRMPDKVLLDDFWCPTCQNTSQESCDASLADTTCPKANFCMTLWDETVFTRKCINRKMLELLTKNCRNVGYMKRECKRRNRRYHLSWCNEPGCKAEVSEISGGKSALEEAATNDFWCQTCQSPSQESCERTLTNTTCPKADHCMALSDKNVFARKCVNKRMLELLTKNCTSTSSNEWKCNRKRKYHVTACNQSGCKAEFSKITGGDPVAEGLVRNDFWCPTCQSTSPVSCETTLTNTTCPKADHCMALSDKNVFARKCVNSKMLDLLTKNCANIGSKEWKCNRKRKYHLTACEQSGCKAEFSKITESKPAGNDFWCPTCQSTSQESCDKTLTNTTCPRADHCIALSDKNVFARKCVNRKMLDLLTKDCRNVGSNEWECERKRTYHVAACDQSGCLSAPNDHLFQCPTCPICKSPRECDHKMAMTKCPTATRCMALRFNGTVDTQSIFTRQCTNEKTFLMIQRACVHKQGCEMTSCTKSGCTATL